MSVISFPDPFGPTGELIRWFIGYGLQQALATDRKLSLFPYVLCKALSYHFPFSYSVQDM